MRLTLENIRGFAGVHSLDIKPLTILVGENSSGKTTLLATLFNALQDDFPNPEAFNRPPFELGSFDTIATYRGGKFGRAPIFSIELDLSEGQNKGVVKASYCHQRGSTSVETVSISSKNMTLTGSAPSGEWTFERDGAVTHRIKSPDIANQLSNIGDITKFMFFLIRSIREKNKGEFEKLISTIIDLTTTVRAGKPDVTALAPLRTRPKRTYDKLIEDFKPEGDHVPLVLARILSGQPTDVRNDVVTALNEFGELSGLYKSLKVKSLGAHGGDPFQVRVKSTGPDVNLVDVGYGVSQALPIVVDSVTAAEGSIVLVQQPEVHLHPRAQAGLGTFFAQLASIGTKSFVIETHSDYLLDRVRMAVAEKVIRPKDVNIVFLERKGLNVQIHQIELDDLGNVLNPPASYRSFFLEEEFRVMSRGG